MPERGKPKIYCSGPLFCPEEVREMSEIARVVEDAGYDAFLPQRDGVEAFVMNSVNGVAGDLFVLRPVKRFLSRATFAVDIYQIARECDCLVFNMNGRVPDEGGVAETAVAFGLGKPVVIYADDSWGGMDGRRDLMLEGVSRISELVDEIDRIPAALYRIFEGHAARPARGADTAAPLSAHMEDTIDFGRRVNAFLGMMGFLRPGNALVDEEGRT